MTCQRSKILTRVFVSGDNYYRVITDDTCIGVAYQHSITLSQFYSWNPAVGSNCQVLLAGYYVCVGVSGIPLYPTFSNAKGQSGC